MIGSVDTNKVHFTSTHGYYDDYDYQFEWDAEQKLNPRYEKEMGSYNKKMEKYNIEMKNYEARLSKYNTLHRQYMKWFHENELKKLNG